jgi:hypothetical protein
MPGATPDTGVGAGATVRGLATGFFTLMPTVDVVTPIISVTLRLLLSVNVTVHEPASFAVTVIVLGFAYGAIGEIAAMGPAVWPGCGDPPLPQVLIVVNVPL